MRANNRFVKNATGNFGRNIPTEICGRPPEVIPNIPVRRNRNGPFQLNSNRNSRNLWYIIESTLGQHFEKLSSKQSTVTFIHSLKCVYSSQQQNYISKSTIYLFPSMTSMRSSAVASYLRVMSALAMRYSLNMDLTESMSSSDWVHYDIAAKTEYYKQLIRASKEVACSLDPLKFHSFLPYSFIDKFHCSLVNAFYLVFL